MKPSERSGKEVSITMTGKGRGKMKFKLFGIVIVLGILISSELFAQDKTIHTIHMNDAVYIQGKLLVLILTRFK